ncbi:MAG: FKBP-type peptidyl-prolyl cis-trans isomerase [Tessaracoccus sp.]|uniref:FKBP-type peptidyl-prolyl cis-trans isomerase n=1 Tax=Tessaracoccus sp. TaxID=1971211 RepID=UPI001EC8A50C|nr:FKBP-type peptidyl-prolyl cis-trans isomerase [Tessaracoccus sp.]MBK7821457.1 FKBP-type peptidyl-prolyl cis-trans isomerase [Tessaracoccus sp.]
MTYTPSLLRRLALGAAAAGLIALTACGSGTPGGSSSPDGAYGTSSPSVSPSASPSPTVSVSPSPDLSGITVTGDKEPKVEVKAPWAIATTQVKVLKKGEGAVVADDATVSVDYHGVNGTTGEVFESSFGSDPVTFQLEGVVAGFKKAIAGQTVGSRVLVGMTPADGYPNGSPDGSIAPGTSLIFVIDIHAASEEVAPVKGLPKVTMKDGKPEIEIPAGVEAPTKLVAQDLVHGPGDKVEKDSLIAVQYRSWTYADGKIFEDAWEPQQGSLDKLIAGWQEGLVGKTVGSRVLLIVPPAKAYPEGRETPAPTLAPNQTLVYVVEILDVAPAA